LVSASADLDVGASVLARAVHGFAPAGGNALRLHRCAVLTIALPLPRYFFVHAKNLPGGGIPGEFIGLLVPALFVLLTNRLV